MAAENSVADTAVAHAQDYLARAKEEYLEIPPNRKARRREASKGQPNKVGVRPIVLRRDQLEELGIWQSNSTLLRLEAAGKFPRRMRLSAHGVAWDRAEIMAWIEARKAERANWHYADAS